ncbi:C-type lectin domain family 12 member B-like [Kryptolebias marmoratus]|uniref:C-type lectin domain family 12 member B-like n=1 Tax=Kryptolebias marmoratus TaxID=37003 RepID=UPI0007F8B4C5|nr:C-type lectin domain family 12 member B-like [Kryptolebias marmoratus]
MAEEDVTYASVVVKGKKQPLSEAKKEEQSVYDEVRVRNETAQPTADAKDSARRHGYLQLLACCLALCVLLVLVIIGVIVYQIKVAKLTAEIQNLKEQNQELQKNLTEQIEKMEETQNELNVSRAQWSIDKYCKQSTDRKCEPCQKGWSPFQSSCYAYNNAAPSDQKTWEEARENCTGKISDLTAVADETEKSHVSSISFPGSGINGYWIGLKAVEGKWRWIDGSELTNNTWVNQPANENQCVISVKDQGSVSCGDRMAWICEKKALSV